LEFLQVSFRFTFVTGNCLGSILKSEGGMDGRLGQCT
jgi:hypothetical protein